MGPAAATCPVEVLTKSEALCEDGSVANLLRVNKTGVGCDGVIESGRRWLDIAFDQYRRIVSKHLKSTGLSISANRHFQWD